MNTSVLKVSGVSKRFGGLQALNPALRHNSVTGAFPGHWQFLALDSISSGFPQKSTFWGTLLTTTSTRFKFTPRC